MIELQTTITEPAKTETTYDGVWIKSIMIMSPNTSSKCVATITVCPMSSVTGELLNSKTKVIRVDDVFAEVQTNPTLAAVIGSIFTAVQDLIITKGTFN